MSTDMPVTPAGIARLEHEAVLSLDGPDACRFLQGQTTADFAHAQAGEVIAGAFCDVKGRVLADFLALIASPERVLLRLSADLVTPLSDHLKKYLMFSKAALTPSELQVFGVLGADAVAALQPEGSISGNAAQTLDQGWMISREPDVAELWLPELPASLSAQAAAADWQAWAIRAGEARVCAATWGRYLPQDLNYDLRDWVNFKKGCYTGQEIIARLHWRGKPKRRLYTASADEALQPEPGVSLVNTEGKSLGSVVNSTITNGRTLLAIEATDDAFESGICLEGSTAAIVPLA